MTTKFGIMTTRRGYMFVPKSNLTGYNTAKRTYDKIEPVSNLFDYQVRLVMVNTINDNVIRIVEEKMI